MRTLDILIYGGEETNLTESYAHPAEAMGPLSTRQAVPRSRRAHPRRLRGPQRRRPRPRRPRRAPAALQVRGDGERGAR